MTENEMRKVVAESVTETLIKLGMDASNPIELQRDLQFVREWRLSAATVKRQSLITAVGIITAGVLGLIWVAFTKGN